MISSSNSWRAGSRVEEVRVFANLSVREIQFPQGGRQLCFLSKDTLLSNLSERRQNNTALAGSCIPLRPAPGLHRVVRHRLVEADSRHRPSALRQVRSHRIRAEVHRIHDQADGVRE